MEEQQTGMTSTEQKHADSKSTISCNRKRRRTVEGETDSSIPVSSEDDPLTIVAKEQQQPLRSNPVSSSSNDVDSSTNTTVYIGNVPSCYCTESVIEKIMSPYGTIQRCNVIVKPAVASSLHHHQQPEKRINNNSNTTRNNNESSPQYIYFAFCQFTTHQEAMDAITGVNGRLLRGQRLTVRFSRNNQEPTAGGGNNTKHRPNDGGGNPVTTATTKHQINRKIYEIKEKLRQQQQGKK